MPWTTPPPALLSREEIPEDIVAAFGKWLAIWRYSHGHLSHAGCVAAFKAHPAWRSA
jgi:hypothetical protein